MPLTSFIVRSGIIASGQVGFPHLANQSVLSGTIGSGQIASGHMSPAFITGLGAVTLLSGQVGSGFVASGAVQGFFGSTRNIASGTIGSFDFGSGAVMAGQLGSGAVQSGNYASGSIASGMLASGLLANIGGGSVTSGSIVTIDFASGAVSPFSEGLVQWLSGFSLASVITQETISGICAVNLNSGALQVAMASVVGRMPAIGIVVDNVASGIQVNVYSDGMFQVPVLSGMSIYSGYIGQNIFVGRSGQIVTSSGSVNSGGLQSGDIYQPIGWAVNNSGISVSVTSQLPFVPGLITSGQIGSGQVGQAALSSGAVQSGQIASGVPVTYARNIIDDMHVTGEIISGQCAVVIGSGGVLLRAQGASGYRMPAFGVASTNYNSGVAAVVITQGPLPLTSGMYALWSGASTSGSILFISSSGARFTPVLPTVATLSQVIGIGISGGIYVQPSLIMASGAGLIGSGILF